MLIFTAPTHVQFQTLAPNAAEMGETQPPGHVIFWVRMHQKNPKNGFQWEKTTFGLHAIFQWADKLIAVVSFRVDDQVHLLSFASVWRFLGNHHYGGMA